MNEQARLLTSVRQGLEVFCYLGFPALFLTMSRGGYRQFSDSVIDWVGFALMMLMLVTVFDTRAASSTAFTTHYRYRWKPVEGRARWTIVILGALATLPLVGFASLVLLTRLDPRWVYINVFAASALVSIVLLGIRFWVRAISSDPNPDFGKSRKQAEHDQP